MHYGLSEYHGQFSKYQLTLASISYWTPTTLLWVHVVCYVLLSNKLTNVRMVCSELESESTHIAPQGT